MIQIVGKEKTENYLRIIWKLQQQHSSARGAEIAEELDVSRPTVSVALKDLQRENYVEALPDSSVILTEKGKEKAIAMTERYDFFLRMLHFLDVEGNQAEKDACLMEHCLSDVSFYAFQKFFLNYIDAISSIEKFRK